MQKNDRRGLLALALALALPGWLSGQTCYVSPAGAHLNPFNSWNNAATNIQTALRAAATNGWSTVLVATGTYNLSQQVSVTNALTMRSWNNGRPDPENTILDGGGTVSPCLLISNVAALVDGFTVTRGQRGVLMYDGVFTNGIITGNGGTNVAVWGAGALMYGDSAMLASRVIANACGTNVGGAGVHMSGNSVVAGCYIAFNTNIRHGLNGSYGGGGVYMAQSARLENSQVISNASGSYGSGIYTATSSNRTNIIRSSLIAGNSNMHNGAGAGIAMIANGMDKVTLVQNCTIVSNYALTYGGGIYVRYNASNLFENTIVYYNGGTWAQKDYFRDTGITSWWTYCCTSYTNEITGMNNTTNAPGFVDFNGNNYRLPANSFLVNAGTNRPWMDGAWDLDGRRRLDRMSRLVDVGCYEYVPRGAIFGVR